MSLGDRIIWKNYTKGIKPINRGKKKLSTFLQIKNKSQLVLERQTTVANCTKRAKNDRLLLPQLDRQTERKLRCGDIKIEAKIDLHGLTQTEAHKALLNFVEKQTLEKRRNLLIVTGKGRKNKSPLRTNLPRWCEAMPLADKILVLRPAAPKHGGDGAWYLVLRRDRRKAGT